jgi:putative addiction module component (TIGR02574 family)
MSVSIESFGIHQLSVSDPIEPIEQIWDSLPEQVAPEDVPEWHRAELAKRRAQADA